MESLESSLVESIFTEIFEECLKAVNCLKKSRNNQISDEEMIAFSENIKKQVNLQYKIVLLSVDYFFVQEILKKVLNK